MQIKNKIEKEKLEKYIKLTEKALTIAKRNIAKEKNKEAKEIINIVQCYIGDAKFFQKNKDYVNAFAAINYAHGWLDTGSCLGIFKVKDNKIFVVE